MFMPGFVMDAMPRPAPIQPLKVILVCESVPLFKSRDFLVSKSISHYVPFVCFLNSVFFFFCRKKKFPPFFPSRIAIVFDWKRFSRRNIQTMAWLEYFATWNSFKANFYGQFINVCVEWFLKFDERKWVREQCARWNEMNHHNALKWINSHFLFKEKEK